MAVIVTVNVHARVAIGSFEDAKDQGGKSTADFPVLEDGGGEAEIRGGRLVIESIIRHRIAHCHCGGSFAPY